jgi:hypothetical protein
MDGAAETTGQHTASTGNEDKETGEHTGENGERKQPAGDELPRGQGEQKEIQRLAKNRVKDDATSCAGCVPEERERGPLRPSCWPRARGDDKRNAERNEAQHRLNRQLQAVVHQ